MALFLVELVLLAVAYQFLAKIECEGTGWATGCTLLRSMVGRAIVVFAAAGVIAAALPDAFRKFFEGAEAQRPARGWVLLHATGVLSMLAPLLLGWGPELGERFEAALPFWLAGALAAGLGGLLWLAPATAWRNLLGHNRYAVAVVLALAALLPDLADAVRPIWDWTLLSGVTFSAVEALLTLVHGGVYADPGVYQIGLATGATGFVVQIGQPCSGVEGFALIASFVALYGFLFRADLRFPLYWLVVLPAGLLASWVLNVLRISALVLIGAHVSPELAVNGFHSYAGWLLFTLLTLGVIGTVQATPWLHKGNRRPRGAPPLRSDLVAAQILPFVIMMLCGVVTSAFLIQPALGYPLVALCLTAALWFVRPALGQLELSADGLSILAGAAVGVAWVVLAPAPTETALNDSLSALGAPVFAIWVAFRLFGTALLVPVVEEMFFRGYLLSRLSGQTPLRRGVALVVTSLAFAALHGRWLAAGGAGLVFGLLAMRRGRVADAIQAHAVANALIALVALARGDWGLI